MSLHKDICTSRLNLIPLMWSRSLKANTRNSTLSSGSAGTDNTSNLMWCTEKFEKAYV